MIKKIALLLCMLAPFGVPAFAQEDLLKKEQGVFDMFCAHCHGKHMVNPGTSSFDLRKFPKDEKERFYNSVNNGRGDMPSWGDILLPEELDLLWHYVITRGGKEPAPFDSSQNSTETDVSGDTAEQASLLITPGTLTACLAKNGGVMSSRRAKGGSGLDYEVAAALADRMGLVLAVEWFESELEEESSPVRENYAMLAYGVCDIIPGFALYETSLSAFYKTRAALPRWDNMPILRRGFQVDLEPISVSDPYARMEMGVVYRTAEFDREIGEVADMEGLRIGVEQGTLAGVLTLRQGTAAMAAESQTLNPGPDFLWRMEQGEFDAALVTVGAYDFHKKQNFVSTLILDEYRHPIGFNLSIAMLKRNRDLLDQIDPMIRAMIDDGVMAQLAAKSKHTYSAPRQPWVQKNLTMQDIVFRR